MPRDYRLYLEDIREAISKIREYTEGISVEVLFSDSKTLDAVVRNLEVIGEAAKMVPDQIRSRKPQVDWKRIAGLRDILIHHYFGIDAGIVVDIVQNKLPRLDNEINALLRELGSES